MFFWRKNVPDITKWETTHAEIICNSVRVNELKSFKKKIYNFQTKFF